MHQPPIPHVASTDPEIAELIEAEARRQFEKLRMIASENYVSRGGPRGQRLGADQQVLRGLCGPALLRGPAVHRPDRDDRGAAGQGPVRRGPRQRPAVLGLAREPGRLPGVPQPGRHRDGDVAADGRAPDSRLAGLRHRQVVPRRAVRRARRHRPDRLRRGARPGPQGAPEDHVLRGHGDSADDRVRRVRGDRGRDRRRARGRHRAHRRADRGRRPPEPGRSRRRDHHYDAQDPARAARRDDHVQGRARVGDRQGRLPRPAGRSARPHHGGDRRGAEGGGRAGVQQRTRTRSWPTPRLSPLP